MEQEHEREHGKKLEKLTGIITGLSAGQRQLTQTALDLQCLALAKKHQIKEQIDLAEELGDVLEILVHLLKETTEEFAGYCPEP
jgi:hypothetical protein